MSIKRLWMQKYKLETSKRFDKDYEKLSKKDKDLTLSLIDKLLKGEILDLKYKDHSLKGNLKDYRDCHIKPDLVLIYKIDKVVSVLGCLRVGSHQDIFKKY